MAKAKTAIPKPKVPVPQDDAQAEQLIAQLGALQRDQVEAQARHDAQVAALETPHGEFLAGTKRDQTAIVEALSTWAAAHRDRLTGNGKTKTVQLASGSILWREGRYAVKHKGLKIEDVVIAIQHQIQALEVKISEARRKRRFKDVPPLVAGVIALEGFLRTKVEPNKEAMLAAREIAETIPGVTVPRGDEEFAVEPLASQISEAA